jgi:hypothetical protein
MKTNMKSRWVELTGGGKSHGVSGHVVGEDDGTHGSLSSARLSHQQHLLFRHLFMFSVRLTQLNFFVCYFFLFCKLLVWIYYS